MYVDLHYTRVLFYHTLMEEAPEILKEVSSVSLFVLLCVCLSFTKLQFTFWSRKLNLENMHVLGRSLMIGWRKKSWNPERVPSVITFVCVCVCVCVSVCLCVCGRATGHTFRPRNLIFGLNDPWDMRKKYIFLFFEIYIFTLFIGIFRFFPYITLVNFCVRVTGHSFSPRDVTFGLIGHFTIRK